MLYEVITSSFFFAKNYMRLYETGFVSLSTFQRINKNLTLQAHVITSYSIHYTKLYDKHYTADLYIKSNFEFQNIPKIIKQQEMDDGRKFKDYFKENVTYRITSYNVCYTKLLRSSNLFESILFRIGSID